MRKDLKLAASLLAAFALSACGGQHLGEDVVEGDDTVALPGVVLENAECQSNSYAAGPYGAVQGSTLINHCFQSSEGDFFSLADIYNDEDASLLLITTSAGWCSACLEEQPYLQQWYTDHYNDGLRIVVTLFEDENLVPANVGYASDWKSRFSLTFPVVADPAVEFSDLGISMTQMGWYYDTKLAPMQMLVDVKTMKILSLDVGATTDTLYQKIQGYLP